MCRGINLQEFISTVPERLRPLSEEYARTAYQIMKEKNDSDVITIDDFSNIKICCEAFVDFLENVAIPETSKFASPDEVEEAKVWVNNLLTDNCDLILNNPNFKSDERRTEKANRERFYCDPIWWRIELEKCIAGEEYDFFDHSLE